MAKKKQPVNENLTVTEFKANAVGSTDVRQQRQKALEALEAGRRLEITKTQNKWMHLGKTSVFASPEKFSHYEGLGYKFTKH